MFITLLPIQNVHVTRKPLKPTNKSELFIFKKVLQKKKL